MIQKKTNFRFKLDNVILKTNKKLQQKQMSLLVSLSTFRKVKKKLWTLHIIMTNLFSNPCPHPVSLLMCHN